MPQLGAQVRQLPHRGKPVSPEIAGVGQNVAAYGNAAGPSLRHGRPVVPDHQRDATEPRPGLAARLRRQRRVFSGRSPWQAGQGPPRPPPGRLRGPRPTVRQSPVPPPGARPAPADSPPPSRRGTTVAAGRSFAPGSLMASSHSRSAASRSNPKSPNARQRSMFCLVTASMAASGSPRYQCRSGSPAASPGTSASLRAFTTSARSAARSPRRGSTGVSGVTTSGCSPSIQRTTDQRSG